MLRPTLAVVFVAIALTGCARPVTPPLAEAPPAGVLAQRPNGALRTAAPTEADIAAALAGRTVPLSSYRGPRAALAGAGAGVGLGASGLPTEVVRNKAEANVALGLPYLARSNPGNPPSETIPIPPPSISLHTIQFAFGSDVLTGRSIETLRNLGNALNRELKTMPGFLIEGHTDAVGSAAYNVGLSIRRAEAVRNYLVERMGVSPGRLQAVGMGAAYPIDPEHPDASQNRRVVVINLSGARV